MVACYQLRTLLQPRDPLLELSRRSWGHFTIRRVATRHLGRFSFANHMAEVGSPLAITTNANDPSVSVEQALRFAGHGSVAAQRPYMRVDETSEAAMMGALLGDRAPQEIRRGQKTSCQGRWGRWRDLTSWDLFLSFFR